MLKTLERTCDECGLSHFVFRTQAYKTNKNGNFCSKDCRQARRVKIHGKDCVNCGTRFVTQAKDSKQSVCSIECQMRATNEKQKWTCEGCQKEFATRNNGTRFCSMKCFGKHTRSNRICMCCGKTWYAVRSTIGGRNHNAFCGLRCAGAYERWESDRKARCVCGKATGKNNERCVDCVFRPKWHELGEWAKGIRGAFDEKPSGWDKRIASACRCLRLRVKRYRPKQGLRKRNVVRLWTESIKRGLSSLKAIRSKESKRTEWTLKLETTLGNLRRRSPVVRS